MGRLVGRPHGTCSVPGDETHGLHKFRLVTPWGVPWGSIRGRVLSFGTQPMGGITRHELFHWVSHGTGPAPGDVSWGKPWGGMRPMGHQPWLALRLMSFPVGRPVDH